MNYYSVLFISISEYPSIISPTLISLKFSIDIPHSYPFLTSLTSSLNLFNHDSLPV